MQIDQLLWATVAPYTYGTFTSSVLSIYCVTQTVGSVVNRPISCADASNDLEEKADESAEQDQDRWCWELWIKWTGWRVEGHLERGKESFLGCKEINLKGNQPWIFIRRIDDEAEAPILWCEEPTHWKSKTLMLGKAAGKRRRRQHRMIWSDSITESVDMNLSKLQETVKDREA